MIIRAKTKHFIYHFIKHIESWDYVSLGMGNWDLLLPFFCLMGWKTAKIWIGTDVYNTLHFSKYRIVVKFFDLFVTKNLASTPWLQEELASVGIESELIEGQYACTCVLADGKNTLR